MSLIKIENLGYDLGAKKILHDIDLKILEGEIVTVVGPNGSGKSTLAYHLINYILSEDEEYKYNLENFSINKDNKSYKLLQNNSHPNFYLIDLLAEKKSIDVGQIREMINYTNKSTFNNMARFILIDNVENLNKNSVNALLKIIEEPNENTLFI